MKRKNRKNIVQIIIMTVMYSYVLGNCTTVVVVVDKDKIGTVVAVLMEDRDKILIVVEDKDKVVVAEIGQIRYSKKYDR